MSFIALMLQLFDLFNPISSFMMKRDWLLCIITWNSIERTQIILIINNYIGRIGCISIYKNIKIEITINIELMGSKFKVK